MKPFLGTNSRPKSRPLGVRSQGGWHGRSWMKPHLSDMEWVAFAPISRFRAPILDTIPTGSFLALRQTFSWCYMPSPDRLRSAPATAGILAPRGNDVTNPVNTGIYARGSPDSQRATHRRGIRTPAEQRDECRRPSRTGPPLTRADKRIRGSALSASAGSSLIFQSTVPRTERNES